MYLFYNDVIMCVFFMYENILRDRNNDLITINGICIQRILFKSLLKFLNHYIWIAKL